MLFKKKRWRRNIFGGVGWGATSQDDNDEKHWRQRQREPRSFELLFTRKHLISFFKNSFSSLIIRIITCFKIRKEYNFLSVSIKKTVDMPNDDVDKWKTCNNNNNKNQTTAGGGEIKVTGGWMLSISDGINNQIEKKKKILTVFLFFLSDVVSFVIFIGHAPSFFF